MIRRLLAVAVRLVLRIELLGARSAHQGPLLFAANHPALLDSLLLSVLLPRDAVVVVPPEEMRAPLLRLALRWRPHLVADMNDPATVKVLLRLIAAGKSVALYPGGQVSEARCVMKVYEVPAMVAAHSGVEVVAVRIRYLSGLLRRVQLHLHQPQRIALRAHASSRERRAAALEALQRLMLDCAFEERERTTLFEAFLAAMERQGRRMRIIEDVKEQTRSYHELLKGALAIGRWAARFSAERENVAVLLPNAIPTVCTVLGLQAFGRVPAMLNYSAGSTAVQSACIGAGVRLVITSRAFIAQARLGTALAAIADRQVLYLEDLRAALSLRDKLWLTLFALWWPRRAISPGRPEGPAVTVFTSGSETQPKGVVLSHESILANIAQLGAVIDFTPDDKVLNPLPIYHSYSFSAGMMLCLVTGTKLFLYISPLRYRAIPEIAYRRNCTYLFGTSTFLSYYAKNADPQDFHSIRYVISGGEKLGADVGREWLNRFGLRIYQGYGATECGPVIALSTPQCFKAGTVGRLLPGLEYRIEKVAGIERGGVLHLRGVQVMLGYYLHDNPGVIVPPRSMFGEGWYNTGDVVAADDEGVMTVVGRVKRFAKIAGEMVSLDVIEEVAQVASPEHRHASVLLTEAATGETTVLYTTDRDLTRSALVHAARRLGRPELCVARRILFMPDLPLLASGKTDYVALETERTAANAAQVGEEPAAVPPPVATENAQAPLYETR